MNYGIKIHTFTLKKKKSTPQNKIYWMNTSIFGFIEPNQNHLVKPYQNLKMI